MKRVLFPVVLLLVFMSLDGKASAQTLPWGERIRDYGNSASDWASQTWKGLSDQTATGTCETCNQPPLRGFSRCWRCLQKQAPQDFKNWCDQAWERSKQALQDLKDPKLTDELIEHLLNAKRAWQVCERKDSDYEREARRKGLESLGKIRLGTEQKELGEYARDAVRKYLPALEGTDFATDPARTISYFLIIDGKGFLKNVRCVRGPNGEMLTLMEEFQVYTRTDKQKAEDILEVMDEIRKLSEGKEQIPALLDAIARSLRVLSR